MAGSGFRSRARRAVEGRQPPTWSLSWRHGDELVDDPQARAVIDLALRVGEALLSVGASAADVVTTVLGLVETYGLKSCHVDVTHTSITVSYHRGVIADPMTVMRIVRSRTEDFRRLDRLHAFVRQTQAERTAVSEARARLDDIVAAPQAYRRWVVTGALAALAAAAAVLFGGTWAIALLSFATTATADGLQRQLRGWGLPPFFVQAAGGALSTTVAVALVIGASHHIAGLAGLSPSLVVASGIVVLLAGLSTVGAAQDAIDGYYVTAAARVFEVLVLTLGIVTGIGVVLSLARRGGTPLELSVSAPLTPNHAVQVAAAVVVAAFFAISVHAQPRTMLVAAAAAGGGWLIYLEAHRSGLGAAGSSALAALGVGFASELFIDRWRVTAAAVRTAGIVPLLPGLAVYRGLFQLVEASPGQGISAGVTTLLSAATIGFALAAGSSLGTLLGRPIHHQLELQTALPNPRS